MDPKQIEFSRLSAERRPHAIERRLEGDPEPKYQYKTFVRTYKVLDHKYQVKCQEGKKHV